jgi:hypothetical protein
LSPPAISILGRHSSTTTPHCLPLLWEGWAAGGHIRRRGAQQHHHATLPASPLGGVGHRGPHQGEGGIAAPPRYTLYCLPLPWEGWATGGTPGGGGDSSTTTPHCLPLL